MTSGELVRFLVIGQIREEFIIDASGRAFQSILGGSLLYAAGSLSHWADGIGLVGVLSERFSSAWRDRLRREKLDFGGVRVIPETFDQRAFYCYSPESQLLPVRPVAAFATAGLPIPAALLDYDQENDLNRENSIIGNSHALLHSFPPDYLDATLAHLCPLDLQAHVQLTTMLQKHSVRIMTLQPLSSSMTLAHWEEIPVVVKGLTAFITTEQEMRELFRKRSENLPEMLEVIGGYGCSCVVVRESQRGYLLYNSQTRKHYRIPDYEVPRLDPTGIMDAFCGGFLAGYSNNYDPIFAAIQGSVAVSHKYEGTGPFSIKQGLPELSQARHELLSRKVVAL